MWPFKKPNKMEAEVPGELSPTAPVMEQISPDTTGDEDKKEKPMEKKTPKKKSTKSMIEVKDLDVITEQMNENTIAIQVLKDKGYISDPDIARKKQEFYGSASN